LEIRKANDDPHEVDELILHMAAANGVNIEQLVQRTRARFQSQVEITPNRIEVHSFEDMLKRIKLESSLKELRILDARPKQ
jgi:phenylacetate-CoA ligase